MGRQGGLPRRLLLLVLPRGRRLAHGPAAPGSTGPLRVPRDRGQQRRQRAETEATPARPRPHARPLCRVSESNSILFYRLSKSAALLGVATGRGFLISK